ncbi:hypothetical protein F2Q69_00005518 [Brassica cretica]|uniref:At2g35280-like TPR domain-containing protein n=1 Tax=Brassica cretica TaxID=69181 RepID=A0A8S9NLC3_BRACR|nr:hypothetical protein F2Q69_00005518 [Brassica cretica]
MRALADGRGVYASFDLYNYPWYLSMYYKLLRRCFEEGNPSTLYIKGVEYFFKLDRHQEGLASIKRAADAGFERALYTYAMTCKIFWEDEEYFSRFTKESVGKIGKVVRTYRPGRNWAHNEAFVKKDDVFTSTVVPLLYSCLFYPLLGQGRVRAYIEDSKAEDMCNRFFWIKEASLFLRDFKPCTGFPDFDACQ